MNEQDYDFYALIDAEDRTRAILAVNKTTGSFKESAENYLDYLYDNVYGHPVDPSKIISCIPPITLPNSLKEYLIDVAKEDAYPEWLGVQNYYHKPFDCVGCDALDAWLPLEILEG